MTRDRARSLSDSEPSNFPSRGRSTWHVWCGYWRTSRVLWGLFYSTARYGHSLVSSIV